MYLYGPEISALKPRTYLLVFVACDLVNLILQGVGGGVSSTLQTPKGIQAGINIVIAGLATQVVSLLLFMGCCAHLAVRLRQNRHRQLQEFEHIRNTTTFCVFLLGLGIGTFGIFIRSAFRLVELHQGFTGPLANNEAYFMVLEGAMILLATLAITIFHPGPSLESYWIARRSKSYITISSEITLIPDASSAKSKQPSSTVTEVPSQ